MGGGRLCSRPDSDVDFSGPMTQTGSSHRHALAVGGCFVLAVVVLAGLWRWTPAGDWLSIDRMSQWAGLMRDSPWAMLPVTLAYVVGCMVVFPLSLLVIATALAFGFWEGFLYAYVGSLAGAAVTYEMGRVMGYASMARMAGTTVDRINHYVSHRGILTMTIMDIFPVAPFSVVNMVAGASHMRFRDYFIGSAIGLIPGLLIIILFGQQLQATLARPSWFNLVVLIGIILAVLVALLLLRRPIGRLLARWEAEDS